MGFIMGATSLGGVGVLPSESMKLMYVEKPEYRTARCSPQTRRRKEQKGESKIQRMQGLTLQ